MSPPETSCCPHPNFFAHLLQNSCSMITEGKRALSWQYAILCRASHSDYITALSTLLQLKYFCLIFARLSNSRLHALLFSNSHSQLAVLALYLGDFLACCVYWVGCLVCRVFHIWAQLCGLFSSWRLGLAIWIPRSCVSGANQFGFTKIFPGMTGSWIAISVQQQWQTAVSTGTG